MFENDFVFNFFECYDNFDEIKSLGLLLCFDRAASTASIGVNAAGVGGGDGLMYSTRRQNAAGVGLRHLVRRQKAAASNAVRRKTLEKVQSLRIPKNRAPKS